MRYPARSPAIISQETAQQVEEMILRRQGGRQIPAPHAFTGIVWCAVCNRPMRRSGEQLKDGRINWRCRDAETELQTEMENTRKGLDDCYARIERLDEAFAAGVMDLDRYAKQIKKVQSRVDSLTERMKSLQAPTLRPLAPHSASASPKAD